MIKEHSYTVYVHIDILYNDIELYWWGGALFTLKNVSEYFSDTFVSRLV